MRPIITKGGSSQIHNKSLTPQHSVPPLLHQEFGMVYQCWDNLEGWIDIQEKGAREKLQKNN